MIRNETVFTNKDGVSETVKYVEIEKVGDKIIAREWSKDTDKVIVRDADEQELHQIESAAVEQEKVEAAQTIEEAKLSDNPEIANLAEAFSKLL